MEITKQRQTAVVNPTLKGLDYLPHGQISAGGSLNNLLDISTDSKDTGDSYISAGPFLSRP